jgi:hypothetical protein
MQIEDKRKAKAKLQATCNSYAERNSSIRFCKLIGQCPSMELRYGCGARLGGSKSNAINLISRLFLYHFLHTMSS